MNVNKIYESVLKRLFESSKEEEITEEDQVENEEENVDLEEMSLSIGISGPATPLGTNAYGKVGKPSDWLKKNRTH